MNSFHLDPSISDNDRRQLLYDGQLVVLSPTEGSIKLAEHAYQMLENAFGGRDPETAQYDIPVEEYAKILSDVKPRFIHHDESKRLIQQIFEETAVDLQQTYFDVPRLRTSTSDDYLTSGIAYAFHPHRDTWYSAPMAQINWWLPVRPITADNTLAFHPAYWDRAVENTSEGYNYYAWNKESRKNAAKHVKKDTRVQPEITEDIDLDPQVRPVVPVGSMVLFSGAQLHSSVPNTSGRTRLSIDFRTVHRGDLEAGRGAPNLDSKCTGTTMRDYLRGSDLTRLPEEIIQAYDDASSFENGELIYQPNTTS